MNEVSLLNALRDCYHPLLRQNLVALNMVRSVDLQPDNDAPGVGIPGVPPKFIARVTVNAPGTDEAQNAQLAAQIENRLAAFEQISRTQVTLLPALFPIL
jgi:metal-sulfur cluster biosynthetic enzyme